MLIGIMGTPVSSSNRGVLALGASLVDLCIGAAEGTDLVLLLNHNKHEPVSFRVAGNLRSVPVVNCRLSPRSRLNEHLLWIFCMSLAYRAVPLRRARSFLSRVTPWIAALENAEFVGDIRGGDSFSDIYGMRRFALGCIIAGSAVLVKGSIVQYPQTYGPYKSRVARTMARFLLKRSSIVIARDEVSRRVAQTLVGSTRTVWLCPDVAFSLEAVRPAHIEMFPPSNGSVAPGVIGLNVNGLMVNGGYTKSNMFGLRLDYRKLLPALVKRLMAEHAGELWLVPHTYGPPDCVESDPEACHQLWLALPEVVQQRVRIVTGEYDQHELKGIIGMCDFFIGSRMHACIAALSQGVPCVGIAYSRKFEGVFDTVGMSGWVVDGRDATDEQAIDRVVELYRMRDTVRVAMQENANAARARLAVIFRQIVSCTRQPG